MFIKEPSLFFLLIKKNYEFILNKFQIFSIFIFINKIINFLLKLDIT